MIHIWVRATVDWDDASACRDQIAPDFRAKVDRWDATFDMPYCVFRARVRDIARANLEAVAGATLSAWAEIPDGALVLPVDDDDWFAPGVAAALERIARPDLDGYRWTSSFIEVPVNLRHALGLLRGRVLRGPPSRYVCTTNNYAMPKRPGTAAPLAGHVQASRLFERPDTRIASLDERLSVMNRTLASQTTLHHHVTDVSPRELVRKYHRYRALYRKPLPAGLEWARPYAARMAELMEQLRPTA